MYLLASQGHRLGEAHGWGHGPWMVIPWLLLWAAVAVFAVYLFRGGPRRWHADQSVEDLLAERYARGEIDDEEYRRRLTGLKNRRR